MGIPSKEMKFYFTKMKPTYVYGNKISFLVQLFLKVKHV